MRIVYTAIGLLWLITAQGQGDFEAAMQAFEEQDYGSAARLFRPLAEAGDADAQYMLGRLFTRGNGVLQDFIQAHTWYNLAAAQGHNKAVQARNALGEQMTPTQLDAAQTAAREQRADGTIAPAPVVTDRPLETIRLSPPQPVPQAVVARIQLALQQRDYPIEPITGEMNEATREAILDYQLTHFMPVTGEPSQALLDHLRGNAGVATISRGNRAETQQKPDWVWRRILFQDGFRDGEFERNPVWRVAAGRFWVESGQGLRSVVEDNGDPSVTQYGEIFHEQTINNAFAIRVDVLSREERGRLEFGPYQERRDQGYRLIYYPDQAGAFELRLRSSQSSQVLARSERRFELEDGRPHELLWTRDADGLMVVSLNDNELMRIRDTHFQEAFDGVVWLNRGGDFTLREIQVHGGN